MRLKVPLLIFSLWILLSPSYSHSILTLQNPLPTEYEKANLEDLETIRKRIIEDLLATGIDEAEIQRLTQTIRTDGSWPGIDYEDVSRTGFEHSEHLTNMLELAKAFKKPGS